MVKIPLSYELPLRNWYKLPSGLWTSVEWTKETRQAAEAARYKFK